MKSKESYKHRAAKLVLSNWLKHEYHIELERPFLGFRPDITASINGQIQAFYEVVHRSELSGKTIGMMQYYCYVNDLELMVHQVDAEYILRQCDRPEKIETTLSLDLPGGKAYEKQN